MNWTDFSTNEIKEMLDYRLKTICDTTDIAEAVKKALRKSALPSLEDMLQGIEESCNEIRKIEKSCSPGSEILKYPVRLLNEKCNDFIDAFEKYKDIAKKNPDVYEKAFKDLFKNKNLTPLVKADVIIGQNLVFFTDENIINGEKNSQCFYTCKAQKIIGDYPNTMRKKEIANIFHADAEKIDFEIHSFDATRKDMIKNLDNFRWLGPEEQTFALMAGINSWAHTSGPISRRNSVLALGEVLIDDLKVMIENDPLDVSEIANMYSTMAKIRCVMINGAADFIKTNNEQGRGGNRALKDIISHCSDSMIEELRDFKAFVNDNTKECLKEFVDTINAPFFMEQGFITSGIETSLENGYYAANPKALSIDELDSTDSTNVCYQYTKLLKEICNDFSMEDLIMPKNNEPKIDER